MAGEVSAGALLKVVHKDERDIFYVQKCEKDSQKAVEASQVTSVLGGWESEAMKSMTSLLPSLVLLPYLPPPYLFPVQRMNGQVLGNLSYYCTA